MVVSMPSRYEEAIYQMLVDEPVTPNEVSRKLGISHKTAQRVLMHLALTSNILDIRSQEEYTYSRKMKFVMFNSFLNTPPLSKSSKALKRASNPLMCASSSSVTYDFSHLPAP